MTPNPTSEVTQEDREAAAGIMEEAAWIEGYQISFDAVRRGEDDRHPIVKMVAAHRLAERNACAQRATQLLNSHPHAPPSPHEIIFAIRHPSGE